MPKTMTLEMVTPEKLTLQATVESIVLPAYEGEMGVLPGHIPFLVMLKAGEVRVTAGGELKSFAVAGGFAEIQKDKVSIFAETAEMAEEIDGERARQALERAKAEAAAVRGGDPLTLAQAQAAMQRAQVRLRVSELRRRRTHVPSVHRE